MNKRQSKKRIKCIIDNIQTINLNENEFLLFRYDPKKNSAVDVSTFAKFISKNVTNKIVFVPTDFEMKKVIEKA